MAWIVKIVSPDSTSMEGGSLAVLRLVRLTRIFRAFKNPKLVEPVIVIARTMSQSSKALYLLVFNTVLGILICGSLMYLVEKGDWDWETRTYQRYEGRGEYDPTCTKGHSSCYKDQKGPSPFESIPHAFWWAIVTGTTVGYGAEFYPTTTSGRIICAVTMVFSLIIGALPIGIIGNNFEQCWSDYDIEKRAQAAQTKRDRMFITTAIERVDPEIMGKLLYIEVWNERFPDEKSFAASGRNRSDRPHVA